MPIRVREYTAYRSCDIQFLPFTQRPISQIDLHYQGLSRNRWKHQRAPSYAVPDLAANECLCAEPQ